MGTPLRSTSALVLVISLALLPACAARSPLDPRAETIAAGGATSTGGIPATGGVTGAGGARGQDAGIPGLPTGAVRVCTYAASGDDYTVTVYRDLDRTTYYLVSKLFASPIVQPIGVERTDLFTYDISIYRTLYVRSLATGLIGFYEGTHDPYGPGSGFGSTCSADADGIQITQKFKDVTLYVELTRTDDTTYRVDIGNPWDTGSYQARFYTVVDGTTDVEIGTASYVVSRDGGSSTIVFTDLEGRRVSIASEAYLQLTAIRVSAS